MKAFRLSILKLLRKAPSRLPRSPRIPTGDPTSFVDRARNVRAPAHPPCLGILVVAFHHARGPVLEHVYPPAMSDLAWAVGVDILSDEPTCTPMAKHIVADSTTINGLSVDPMRDVQDERTPMVSLRVDQNTPMAHRFSIAFTHDQLQDDRGVGLPWVVKMGSSPTALRRSELASLSPEAQEPMNLTCRMLDVIAATPLIPFLALPDGAHKFTSDFVYFVIPTASGFPLFGVSCSRRIAVDPKATLNPEITREFVQKAVCVISQVPAFPHLRARLQPMLHCYLDESGFTDLSVSQALYHQLNGRISESEVDVPENPFHGLPAATWNDIVLLSKGPPTQHRGSLSSITGLLDDIEPQILRLIRPKHLLYLLKAFLLEAKVLVYAHDASVVSSLVLTLVSLLPGASCFGVIPPGAVRDERLQMLEHSALPLHTWHDKCLLLPYATLQMKEHLAACDGFLAGISNNLLLVPEILEADIVVLLNTETGVSVLEVRRKGLSHLLELSSLEARMIRHRIRPAWCEMVDDLHTERASSRSTTQESLTSSEAGDSDNEANQGKESIQTPVIDRSSLPQPDKSSGERMNQVVRRAIRRDVLQSQASPFSLKYRSRSTKSSFTVLPRLPRGMHRANLGEKFKSWEEGASPEGINALRHEFEVYFDILLRLTSFAAGPARSRDNVLKLAENRRAGFGNFNIGFIQAWSARSNFIVWLQSHNLPMIAIYTEPPRSGFGELTYSNGDVYKGAFANGYRDGKGVYCLESGWVYEGDWASDKRHGFGVLKSESGDFEYKGNWIEDQRTGKGCLQTKDFTYVGDFADNLFNGKGILCNRLGTRYEGELKDGKFNGEGHILYPSGESYTGQFYNGRYHGRGQRIFPDGRVCEGWFMCGEINGHGRETYASGSKFVGLFSAGARAGLGTFTTSSGIRLTGRWLNDAPQMEGEWRIVFPNGTWYEGNVLYTPRACNSQLRRSGTDPCKTPTSPPRPCLLPHGTGHCRNAQSTQWTHGISSDGLKLEEFWDLSIDLHEGFFPRATRRRGSCQ